MVEWIVLGLCLLAVIIVACLAGCSENNRGGMYHD